MMKIKALLWISLAAAMFVPTLATAATPTPPDAPTIGPAFFEGNRVQVNFTPPANDGGSPITSYTATSSPGNFTATGSSSPIYIPIADFSTPYTFTVTATNAVGTSPPSAPSNIVTGTDVPLPPVNVTATAGNGQATVTWTPVQNGAHIRGYDISSTPEGHGGSSITTSFTATGLTNGVAYTFTVTAVGVPFGVSPPSAPSNVVIPSADVPPDPPTITAVIPGDGQVAVQFVPGANGGPPVTSCTVLAYPNGNFSAGFPGASGLSSPLTVTGLSNGTPYGFRMYATNAAGNSGLSNHSDVVTPTPSSNAPPTLSVSTLPDGAVTNNLTLNVSGSVTAGSGLMSLTVNGSPVAVAADGTFSTALTLHQGSNVVATIATDNLGRQATDTRTIIADTTAPLLTVTAPVDNSITKQTTVKVIGSVDDDTTAGVTVSVDPSTPQPASIIDGVFTATVTLDAGSHTIYIVATDLAGNSTTAKRTVEIDLVSPELSITAPGEDTTTHSASYLLVGNVTDSHTATVFITTDGPAYMPEVTAGGSFQQQLTFRTEGTHPVTVVAMDRAGNATTMQRNIIYTLAQTGDINGDQVVDTADALLALQFAIGSVTPTATQVSRGDVAPVIAGKPSPDGVIDVGDVVVILRKTVGLPVE